MAKVDSDAFKLDVVDEHHAKATSYNMLFALWHKDTTAEAYRRAGRTLRQLAAAYPMGVGVLHTVEPDAMPPDPAARVQLHEFMKVAETCVKHYSVLHEGTGFKAAAVRAVVTGLYVIARPNFEHAVFKSLPEAAGWHAMHQRLLGRNETPEQIAGVVRKLREIYADHVWRR